jgi:hypothetical protein
MELAQKFDRKKKSFVSFHESVVDFIEKNKQQRDDHLRELILKYRSIIDDSHQPEVVVMVLAGNNHIRSMVISIENKEKMTIVVPLPTPSSTEVVILPRTESLSRLITKTKSNIEKLEGIVAESSSSSL